VVDVRDDAEIADVQIGYSLFFGFSHSSSKRMEAAKGVPAARRIKRRSAVIKSAWFWAAVAR